MASSGTTTTRRRAALVLAVAAAAVLAACSAPGATLEAQVPVAAVRIAAPIHEPVFSFSTNTLLGLTDDHRVASIDVAGATGQSATARTTFSAPLGDTGRNLQISPLDDSVAFVPQPKKQRVLELKIDDLRPIGTLQAGPSPDYLSQDSGYKVLLALSRDGSAVTAVDLHQRKVLGTQPVAAGPAGTVEGAKRGRVIDFHVLGPRGIKHYKDHLMPAEQDGRMNLAVDESAGDPTKSSKIYVALHGTDRLLAVDTKREMEGLEIVGQANLGEPVRYVAADDTRIYAVTDHKLVVLETNSFEGYQDGTIPVLRTFDYRSALSGPARTAPLEGITVGHDHVYLALRGQPYVVSIAKPHL